MSMEQEENVVLEKNENAAPVNENVALEKTQENVAVESNVTLAKSQSSEEDKVDDWIDRAHASLDRKEGQVFSEIQGDVNIEREARLNDKSVERELRKAEAKENAKNKGKKPAKPKADKSPKEVKSKIKFGINRTVQQTIPYRNVYQNGIIEVMENMFSKSYILEDINFRIASDSDQENIFLAYGDLLNSFGHEVLLSITINNKNLDKQRFKDDTLISYQNDANDVYREEINEMLISKMNEGKNNLVHEKYLTITISANNIEDAVMEFSRIDGQVAKYLKKITKDNLCQPLTTEERLEILYNIYNLGSEVPFRETRVINGKEVKRFDIKSLNMQGITTKDVIAPASFEFKSNFFKMGDIYGQALYVENYPTYVKTDLLPDIADLAANMLVTVHFNSMRQDKAIKMIKNQMTNINSNVVEAQKKASQAGYSPDLISPSLQKAQSEADKLLADVTGRNQKIFFVTLVVAHFADNKEELFKNTKNLEVIFNRHLITAKPATYQQEYGLTSALPIGLNLIEASRLNTTESASVFIPFSAQEWRQKDGYYYGINTVSRNMIIYNRKNGHNFNGVILGMPGAGKSFKCKEEIVDTILGTTDDVFVIDPEREYVPLAKLLGGEVVKIVAGGTEHINPFDLDIDDVDDGNDPIANKADFITSLCEVMMHGPYGITPVENSIIDRCVRKVYEDYVKVMNERKSRNPADTFDPTIAPTFKDFYDCLLQQEEVEAASIAVALERYVTGSLNSFAYRTTVDTKSRFVVYDIKDIGPGMQELGLQVCLDTIWQKIVSNKRKKKYTWAYIDELHLFAKRESSAKYIQNIYKRARKWNGIPTGMTQQVSDLLTSQTISSVISTSAFVVLLNQAPLDKIQLSEMFHLSDEEAEYITNADRGQGLLVRNERSKIPFTDEFPKDTKLYGAMTTTASDQNAAFAEM